MRSYSKRLMAGRGVTINKWDRVTGYVLLVIGVVTAWSSTHLSMGKWRHPGPVFSLSDLRLSSFFFLLP